MTHGRFPILTALGIMSGTSLDGLDLALLQSDGDAHVQAMSGKAYEFPHDLQRQLLSCQGILQRTDAVAAAESTYSDFVIACVQDFLAETHSAPDYIGWHGQTIAHAPHKQKTLQLGDAQALAQATDIAVVHDFRNADISAGGQGAPLAPIYHRALAINKSLPPCMFVNIGGVANITYYDGDTLIAFDCGPGNALIDDAIRQTLPQTLPPDKAPTKAPTKAYDEDGKIAAAGHINEALLQTWQKHPYFAEAYPKSLDREDFHDILSSSLALNPPDLADKLATLTEFTVWAILHGAEQLPTPPHMMILCGGGRHNRFMCARLQTHYKGKIIAIDELGFDGDLLEAQAFAYLAVRHVHNLPLSYPLTTGVRQALCGGILARPQ